MAACTFNIDNTKHVSELQKVTRDDLYGSRRVQALALTASHCGGQEFPKRATFTWFQAMSAERCAPASSLP